ncbi:MULTISPECIES: hypothetical protein [Bacillus cereus group]|uniref:hypothetical protein n=1 Tax=Bacillus cereus group TaxID=86661 RepID=UPI000BFC911A|nr:hypothetical protein [Bacillus thuringiensis]PGL50276.1 hypothetical protein CN914_11185 [Bacillus thuringiensis]
MNNAVTLWQSPNGIDLPAEILNPTELVAYINPAIIPERDIMQIKVAFDAKIYPMAAEFTWTRAINFLKAKIMGFGRDFVLEMLGRNDENLGDDFLTQMDVINLATDLGFINQTAKMYFIQTREMIQHFSSPDITDSMDYIDSLKTTKTCVKYVLGLDQIEMDFSYNSFRERLIQEIIATDDSIVRNLVVGPYFFKRTTVRTLLNLAKKVQEGAEKEKVLANTVTILHAMWEGLLSEDKWPVGFAYAEAVNIGKRDLVKALKSVLLKVKGFDYVPENLRSMSFIDTANKLLDTHYGFDNFYRETAIAQQLLQMGTSIPKPALGRCMTAIIACKLGNRYGRSNGAQEYLDKILDNLIEGSWSYYINEVLPADETILLKLTSNTRMVTNWMEIVHKYNLHEINAQDGQVTKIVKQSHETNVNGVVSAATTLISKIR